MNWTPEQREAGRQLRARILEHLERHGPASSATIAEALGAEAVPIGQHIARLRRDKRVRIVPPVRQRPSIWELGAEPERPKPPPKPPSFAGDPEARWRELAEMGVRVA